jgi:hypothetical protein
MNNIFSGAALPRLSAENRLRQLQHELGVSAAFIAALADISPVTLSNAYRGVKSLDNDIATELLEIVRYLVEITDALRPWFALPLKNPNETRQLVDQLRDNGVTPEKIRAAISKLLAGEE